MILRPLGPSWVQVIPDGNGRTAACEVQVIHGRVALDLVGVF